MRRALVSDIHGNIEALDAVTRHLEARGVDEIVCLGDVIGYGPEPRICLQRAMTYPLCLRGNHEAAALEHGNDFNALARVALDWTRDQLNSRTGTNEENHRLWNFLDGLRPRAERDGALLVHGSPRDPIREYVLPRDARNSEKMREIFERIDGHVCFVGHSHVPGVYTEDGQFLPPRVLAEGYEFGRQKALINVGSVGQPRDRDNRACYVIWEDDRVVFHRVDYDYETTMRKILDTSVLPRHLAERLEVGN